MRSMHRLRMALSEQNLELLPDYEQRIEVLKELQFIDENSTVLLKGRVACEVRPFHLRRRRKTHSEGRGRSTLRMSSF